MTEYDVWLYKDKAVQIRRTQIKCDRRDVPGQAGLHRAGLPEERPVSGHHAGHGQRRLESYLIPDPVKRRCRESVPPSIPMQYGRGGGMMPVGRICVRQNNGGPFRMHACRKITGPAP